MPAPTLQQRLTARQAPVARTAVLRQIWSRLLFLHWEVPVPSLAARLPSGLAVDTWEGRAFLGVVPFAMRRVRPRGLTPVPGISDFLELNVRTYVHDESGTPGVWFFSLDANQPLAVEVARRWFWLNYQHAAMSWKRENGVVHYRCRRHGQRETAVYQYPEGFTGELAEPGTLEFFVLERYYLYAWNSSRRQLCRGQVAHEPYRFRRLLVPDEWSALPARWEGFALEGPPVHTAVAEEVSVRTFALQAVAQEPASSR